MRLLPWSLRTAVVLGLLAAGLSTVLPLCQANAEQRSEPETKTQLQVATCQFPVSQDIARNAEWIRQQMRQAKTLGADIAHFPEAALSGYAGVDLESLDGFDWQTQRSEMEAILGLARELQLWLVLGATHQLSGDNKPHNSLYVINARGEIVDRYDKRFCTSGDLRHYTPGDHFATFEVNGVKCGLLICYDIRFPELYRQYKKLDVQLIFHSFYNARQKPGSIHPKIMPPTAQARAATNYLFLSVNNSSGICTVGACNLYFPHMGAHACSKSQRARLIWWFGCPHGHHTCETAIAHARIGCIRTLLSV
ncbi:MAG: carbon-nitrogen hydrolase family protein [bacterium]|nr:carbon-nitrogen hydrolase family protein [bacterium]